MVSICIQEWKQDQKWIESTIHISRMDFQKCTTYFNFVADRLKKILCPNFFSVLNFFVFWLFGRAFLSKLILKE